MYEQNAPSQNLSRNLLQLFQKGDRGLPGHQVPEHLAMVLKRYDAPMIHFMPATP